ncbi:hypothetical protein [Luteolibacter sp. Populi]|uniref:hypothetical protein n=1 Tax=Luteolibacter sp. Populi TaxID=3230487 RepID=UPI0034653306
MKLVIQASLLTLSVLACGCGTIHRLPGHHRSNELSPPPVTMKSGEKRLMVTTGLERFVIAASPALRLRSDDPSIAGIGGLPGSNWSAWLVAGKPGTTRVYYHAFDKSTDNKGFQLTVLESKP